jgi:hypothetical protein
MSTHALSLREIPMIRKTRTVVVATLALAALTGCGSAAAEARGAHTYEPLPPLSTATPTTSPAPQPTSPPAPTSSPAPSAAPDATAATPSTGAAGSAGAGAVVASPVQAPVLAGADAAAPVAAPVVAAPVAAAPVQVTETVSTTTSSMTTTTLEAQIMIVITCEGWCDLSDLTAPELTGADGPISPASIQDLLEAERQGGDEQKLTEELIDSLAKEDWDLLEQQFKNGQEKFVFTSATDRG